MGKMTVAVPFQKKMAAQDGEDEEPDDEELGINQIEPDDYVSPLTIETYVEYRLFEKGDERIKNSERNGEQMG